LLKKGKNLTCAIIFTHVSQVALQDYLAS
jgi:hypothetical protein